MRTASKLCIAAVASILLMSALAVSSDALTPYRVVYKDSYGVQVDFPDGKRIQSNGDLVLTVSSDTYDMSRAGIWFYEYNDSGEYPESRHKYEYLYDSDVRGRSVTYTFHGISSDIEMILSDLVPYEDGGDGPGTAPRPDTGPVVPDDPPDGGPLLPASAVLLILSAVLLSVSVYALNYFERIIRNDRGMDSET